MRRYLVLLLLSFVFLCVSAEEHMEYMGVSMGMPVDEFTAAMKEKGYALSAANAKAPKGIRLMQGDYAGGKVMLELGYGVHTNMMTSVTVRFPQ